MSHEVLWEPTKDQTQGWESKDEEGMVKEGSEPTGNIAGLSEMNRSTMGVGMPKLTQTGQLQIMQGKSDVIIKLQ